MDDGRWRAGTSGDGRDDLDLLIDGALDQMRGGGPADVRASVLARLDEPAGAPLTPWAVWRMAAVVGAIALVVAVAAAMTVRRQIQHAGRIADSRSAAAPPQPVEQAPGRPRESTARFAAEPPRAGTPVPIRQGRSLTDARLMSRMGDTNPAGWEDEPPEAQQGAQMALPGAPVGMPGEPIPLMSAPTPVVIPAFAPAPIAVTPSVGNLGTPLGILPIADPARVITNIEKSGGTSP